MTVEAGTWTSPLGGQYRVTLRSNGHVAFELVRTASDPNPFPSIHLFRRNRRHSK